MELQGSLALGAKKLQEFKQLFKLHMCPDASNCNTHRADATQNTWKGLLNLLVFQVLYI